MTVSDSRSRKKRSEKTEVSVHSPQRPDHHGSSQETYSDKKQDSMRRRGSPENGSNVSFTAVEPHELEAEILQYSLNDSCRAWAYRDRLDKCAGDQCKGINQAKQITGSSKAFGPSQAYCKEDIWFF
jgi:hypothetical protein